jgi:hypothetical protein
MKAGQIKKGVLLGCTCRNLPGRAFRLKNGYDIAVNNTKRMSVLEKKKAGPSGPAFFDTGEQAF